MEKFEKKTFDNIMDVIENMSYDEFSKSPCNKHHTSSTTIIDTGKL